MLAKSKVSPYKVRTLFFWTKNSGTFKGLSRTDFPFFKDSMQLVFICFLLFFVATFLPVTFNFELVGWMKLPTNFKDFPTLTAIFKAF